MKTRLLTTMGHKLRCLQYAAGGLLLWGTAQAATWVGTADSNFENGQNWRNARHGTVMAALPQAGIKNDARLLVVNGSGFPLSITEAEGTTTFSEQLGIGSMAGKNGEIKVSGGALIIQLMFPAFIGLSAEGQLVVQGGLVDLLGGGKDAQINGCDVYWTLVLGNEKKGNGRVFVTGGEVRVENGFQIGRNGGSGILEILGAGRFTCGGPILFPGGSGKASIILGGGTFEQTKNEDILFLSDSNKGWFSFNKGSQGKISLCGRDKAYFDALVNDGRIRIEDVPTTPDHFTFKQNANQGELHLAQ